MEHEATSKASAGGGERNGLSTVYVPLNHRHHETANVLYGIIGNPRESLPECDSAEYLEFYHNLFKVSITDIPNL